MWQRLFIFFIIIFNSSDAHDIFCSQSTALNCFMSGVSVDYKNCSNILRNFKKIYSEIERKTETKPSPIFINIYRICVLDQIKNYTKNEENKTILGMLEQLGSSFGEGTYLISVMKKLSDAKNRSSLQKLCQIAKTFSCFSDAACLLNSHNRAIIDVLDICQNETHKKILALDIVRKRRILQRTKHPNIEITISK